MTGPRVTVSPAAPAVARQETCSAASEFASASLEYSVIVDGHDTPLPTDGQYYNCPGGDRGW